MPQEVADLDAAVESPETIDHAGRRFVRGRLFGRDAIVVHARVGKVAAATTAAALIERFGCGELIFTGVAGAVSPDLRIGDIVIADALIQHDLDARPLFPRYEVPLAGMTRYPIDPARVDTARRAAETFANGDLTAAIAGTERALLEGDDAPDPAELLAALHITVPRIHTGLVASGDQFFADGDAIAALRRDLPDALCVEMEGAAVAQVAHDHGVPCSVIRTISDGGDDDAVADFGRALGLIAAAWSHGILANRLAGP